MVSNFDVCDESTHLPMSDSHVVVTGSSSGIGKATAIEMAKQGARKVLIHYRSNIRGAEGTAKEIEGFGASATHVADLCLRGSGAISGSCVSGDGKHRAG